ncbi:CTP synthase [Spiroplasma endosymbiont of Megaselia nigra]|uniref:CTP synthase n=1 Tax=Spiroplasma endosymbiont of Megaselia nigra TaxID=2478537 RepID=UPI000F882847|nr:CTP synthase [Spiroplasma endosymbiont of Megaselia nigra]RUO86767.1 CTP synthase [Spiroplasma endosymbiont of Megaselia nigra]
MAKYIFVTGGVVSGLGKGITASSIGVLLKASGLNVFMQKFDPYLNVDPGTMSPYQHGEVFVTADGAETDLDLGHYERFIDENLTKESNITSGRIYKNVIEKERRGEYEGGTVQVVPHVTNEIKKKVYHAASTSKADIIITEIGGTVGDIESLPFIEAIRQVRMEQGRENVIYMHVSLVPYIAASKESKTKPTQHSVRELLSLGIQPDIVVARTEQVLEDNVLEKIALFCNIEKNNVLVATDVASIYEVPLKMYEQNAQIVISKLLNLKVTKTDMSGWKQFVEKINHSQEVIEIKLVGKYIELPDAYLSVSESLRIAGYENKVKIKIDWIKAEDINKKNYQQLLKNAKGILVPGGFGERGFEGKILACQFARENNIPFFGICFGMQAAVIEFARNVCHIQDANSSELTETKNAIIDIIRGKDKTDALGGTLRLGNYKTTLVPNTLAHKLYGKDEILERHRHRYEVNNDFREQLAQAGLVFSGLYAEKNLVEVIEIPNHPFYLAAQYHPEFTSRPNKPNPLFNGFVQAVINNK